MKKHEVIQHAYENYPKGTKFTWSKDTVPKTVESSGKFIFMDDIDGELMLADSVDKDLAVWNGNEWAEIVKPKIAVKVENEKEFKALMKYYDSLGWKWNGGKTPLERTTLPQYPNLIMNEDGFMHSLTKETIKNEDYQIIPFSEFAAENKIKLPLLTSEDGVDLYEDSDIHIVWKENFGWSFDNSNKGFKCDDGSWYVNPEIKEPNRKLFSTKHAALDWIEAQKPKSEIVSMNNHTQETEVFKDGKVLIRYAGMEIPIHYYDLSRLQEAYKRLNK